MSSKLRTPLRVVVGLLLGVLVSCASPYRLVDSRVDHIRHLIEVDRHGAFVVVERECRDDAATGDLRECRLLSGSGTPFSYTPADFEATQRGLDKHITQIELGLLEFRRSRLDSGLPFSGVLLFVHGGLNSKPARFARVLRDSEKVRDAGYYPIYISWNSGPFSTYVAHLLRVRQGRRIPLLQGILTSPIWLLRDLAGVAAAAPVGWYQQLSGHFYGVVNQPVTALAGMIKPEWGGAPPLPPHSGHDCATDAPGFANARVCIAGSDDTPRYWWPFRTATHLLTFPAKLVTTPFVLGIGDQAWEMMRRRTRTLLHSVDEFEQATPPRTEPVYPEGAGAVSQVAKRLLDLQAAEDRGRIKGREPTRIPITMVGHSMGAIIINQILVNYPDLEIDNIVYMAGAANVGNTTDAVYPYLIRHPEASFYTLVLHPYAERRELSLYGLAPSGSLLQWIDEVYGSPVNATDRRVGKWENLEYLLYKVPPLVDDDGRRRVTVKVFGFDRKCGPENSKNPTLKCDPLFDHPVAHGDFSEGPYWDRRFWGAHRQP